MQTRLAPSLEDLDTSLAQSAGKLCWCKVLQKSGACGSSRGHPLTTAGA